MKLRNIMTRNVAFVHPDDTLQQAAEKMRANDVGSLPVCEGPGVFGVITDRDITVRAVAKGCDPKMTLVRDFMSGTPVFCYDDEDVKDAARIMEKNQIRRLLVLGRDKSLAGIVSLADVALEGEDDDITARTLEGISQPA